MDTATKQYLEAVEVYERIRPLSYLEGKLVRLVLAWFVFVNFVRHPSWRGFWLAAELLRL